MTLKGLPNLLDATIIVAAAAALGFGFQAVFWRFMKRIADRTRFTLDNSIVLHLNRPSRLFVPVIAVYIVFPGLTALVSARFVKYLDNVLAALLTVSLAWIVISLLSVIEDVVLRRERVDMQDNLKARKIYTQMQILKRIGIALICVVTLAVLLLHYDEFRRLGTSILASAGLAGLVIGFAAQRTLGNLFAGIQLAITEPIRLDDVVIVEGEWGRIEEITLTYVVVRIWDLRRLIVPINYFMEKPFQNWTRVSADLLGSVFIYSDYALPVDALRKEFHKILSASKYWDGKVEAVHVTNATDHTLEIRALASAADSSSAWELRCEVREKLIAYIRTEHPDCLPRLRAEFSPRSLPPNRTEPGRNEPAS